MATYELPVSIYDLIGEAGRAEDECTCDECSLLKEQQEHESEKWQRGDVILDGSGNMFVFHNLHGWFGLASNQPSCLGHHEPWELAEPRELLIRDHKAVVS